MLDLIFFTPGTKPEDKEKVKKMYDKIVKSFWDSEMCTEQVNLYKDIRDDSKFHLLIGTNCPDNLKLEVEVETLYELKDEL